MFSNLFFLILVLLLVGFAPESNGALFVVSPWEAFGYSFLCYLATLGIIAGQNRAFKNLAMRFRGIFLYVANIELVTFFVIYHFFLAGHRVFPVQILLSLTTLCLYLLGIFTFHLTLGPRVLAWRQAVQQIRLLVPFALPFLAFTLILDAAAWYPDAPLVAIFAPNEPTALTTLFVVIGCATFMVAMMFILPPLIMRIWHCHPLPEGPLRHRLEALCARAKFRHAGIKVWSVMSHSLTAGIIGVFSPVRYVMFTERLLNEVPAEAIEAVLAHEIGHSYRRHLLLYPFIIFGMVVSSALFSQLFGETIEAYFALQNMLHPSLVWALITPLALFVPYALILALYFRIVFGYFSRLFERQADLHVFKLNLPPEHMIYALDYVAIGTGYSHRQPSWHHFSIQQRMDFLQAAIKDQSIIERHHQRVRRNLRVYFFCLILGTLTLISPLFEDILPFSLVNDGVATTSFWFSEKASQKTRNELAEKAIISYDLEGEKDMLIPLIAKGYAPFVATQHKGLAEYVAAANLTDSGDSINGAKMLTAMWQLINPTVLTKEAVEQMVALTDDILKGLPEGPVSDKLKVAYKQGLQLYLRGEE